MTKRWRVLWLITAAACALVALASIAASVVTGMGWWGWHYKGQHAVLAGTQISSQYRVRWHIDRGGVYYAYEQSIPVLSGIPIVGNFFTVQAPAAWVPGVSISSGQREVIVPFWTVGAIALVGCAFAWRRSRRPGPGQCAKCRYDLSGLIAGAPCPECGTNNVTAGIRAGAI